MSHNFLIGDRVRYHDDDNVWDGRVGTVMDIISGNPTIRFDTAPEGVDVTRHHEFQPSSWHLLEREFDIEVPSFTTVEEANKWLSIGGSNAES